jgi:hypothetical protein
MATRALEEAEAVAAWKATATTSEMATATT